MTQHDDDINARLTKLYADYRQQLPERINHISQLFEAYCAQTYPPTALADLHYALHKLAGSGATFGHPEMGNIARRWEHLVGLLMNSAAPPSSLQQQEMLSLLKQLSQAARLTDAP